MTFRQEIWDNRKCPELTPTLSLKLLVGIGRNVLNTFDLLKKICLPKGIFVLLFILLIYADTWWLHFGRKLSNCWIFHHWRRSFLLQLFFREIARGGFRISLPKLKSSVWAFLRFSCICKGEEVSLAPSQCFHEIMFPNGNPHIFFPETQTFSKHQRLPANVLMFLVVKFLLLHRLFLRTHWVDSFLAELQHFHRLMTLFSTVRDERRLGPSEARHITFNIQYTRKTRSL